MSCSAVGSCSNASQAQLAQEVGVRVVAKTLEAAKAQGDAAISLLQAAADIQKQTVAGLEPHKGQAIDVSA